MGEIADALEVGAQSAQLELLEDWDRVERFIYAGRAMFTLKSRKTGRDFTYKLTKGTHYVFVSVESGGYMKWQNVGRFKPYQLPKVDLPSVATSFKSLLWFLHALNDRRTDLLDQIEFKHLGKCGRCGRPLTDSESIDRGIGPDCWEKMTNV